MTSSDCQWLAWLPTARREGEQRELEANWRRSAGKAAHIENMVRGRRWAKFW
jgi:hypothetical protein